MRKFIALSLCLLVVLSFAGCKTRKIELEDVPTFYYLRNEMTYGAADSVIAPQQLRTAEAGSDLEYLLALYFAGPTDGLLRSPYPDGTAVLDLERSGTVLTLTMNGAFARLNGLEFTKACACLAMTVFGITDAEEIIIQTEDAAQNAAKAIQFNRDSLVLEDTAPVSP